MSSSKIETLSQDVRSTDDGARAILRVPEILMAVAARPDGSSFVDLQHRLELPKASLHRLLKTLEKASYLVRTEGRYRIGPATVQMAGKLGSAITATDDLRSVSPILQWLANTTGESVMLAELGGDGQQVFYVEVINSKKPLRFTVPPGHSRPLFAAASGQVILAYLPPETQAEYLATANFVKLTDSTLGHQELTAQLRSVRKDGIAFDRNGSFVGAGSIAAPCFDAHGNIRCAISVAGPVERLEAELSQLSALVLEAGRRVSTTLGYRGPYPA